MDLDLRLVRYFVVVADELHFGRAAARLYISQPALSKQIRKLEDQIGAQLLVRDSRHVTLTPRGERFHSEARQLIAIADRIQLDPQPDTVRIAHIFELTTSRTIADAYVIARPDIQLEERAMDSVSQLRALMNHLLDVAVVRLTPGMLAEHPRGWHHHLLRVEPFRLVGRPGDPPRETVSLHERPIEVFADALGTGLYNAYGEYLTTFERHAGVSMRWLGTPGAFSHCLAHMSRAKNQAFSLEFDSYARRYADEGLPIHRPAELQPHFPWSIAWRDGDLPQPVADYVDIALKTSETRDWQHFSPVAENPWLPPDVPVQADLTRPGRWSDEQVPARESAMKPHAGTHQGGGSGRHENNP